MGGACCKSEVVEFNPDDTPKDPQTKEQMVEDPKDLRRAAKEANWKQMRMLLRRMPYDKINSRATKNEGPEDEVGNTPLHFSVSINHLKGIHKLVRYGHSVMGPNALGKSPLHMAVETGKLKAVELLFKAEEAEMGRLTEPGKAQWVRGVNRPDAQGMSPFLSVVASGRKKLLGWLMETAGEAINYAVRDFNGNSALLYVAKYGWMDLLETLLEKIAENNTAVLNTRNASGESVLGWVLKYNASGLLSESDTTRIVTTLLSKGAVASLAAFQEVVPPICLAAAANNLVTYRLLIEKGANPELEKDAMGRTALHYAAAKGAQGVFVDLQARGLLPTLQDKQGNTALHLAGMRGQEATVKLILEKTTDVARALLQPNFDGMSTYHLALQAGPEEEAQNISLHMIEEVGAECIKNVMGRKEGQIINTPLLLAISGHQDRVVKKLLEKGCKIGEPTSAGELPLARNLASATAATYDNDGIIFDTLIDAGADANGGVAARHPLLAVCKNNLSNFAERVVGVLASKGPLDWAKQDEKGYTPLMLASFHDNAWLVRHLLETVKVDPNDPGQRTKSGAPVMLTSGGCCKSPVMGPGVVGGQTPLMCAAKGASEGAIQILLNRGAMVSTKDDGGKTALAHAMHLDRINSLYCANMLISMGAQTENCTDLTGESWPHRAVRYGSAAFLKSWFAHGGSLDMLATTKEDADDMPGAEIVDEEKGDFLDMVPKSLEAEEEEEDQVLEEEAGGEDSETENAADEPTEDDAQPEIKAGAVAEGLELWGGAGDNHFGGPTMRMRMRWRRMGAQWWDRFFPADEDEADMPPLELEDDLDYQDKYNCNEEGDEFFDEEDVMDEVLDQQHKAMSSALPRGRIRPGTLLPSSGSGDLEAEGKDQAGSSLSDMASGLLRRMSRGKGGMARPNEQELFVASMDASVGGSMSRRSSAGPVSEGIIRQGSAGPVAKGVLGRRSSTGAAGNGSFAQLGQSSAGPIAEATEVDAQGRKVVKIGQGMNAADLKETLANGTPGEKLWASEPFYQPATRYNGLPKYMDTNIYPTTPLVNCKDKAKLALLLDGKVDSSENSELGSGKWNMKARLDKYRFPKERQLVGADLRNRNIKWYLKSMSPEEFPLSQGRFKAFLKKIQKAADAAKLRRPAKPGQKVLPRKKTAWFGLPDLPSRPELNKTSPLVYAVRLGRVECVKALLELSPSINIPDGFGLTPLQYSMYLLLKDRHNKVTQHMTDMVIAHFPHANSRTTVSVYLLPRAREVLKNIKAIAPPNPKAIKAQEQAVAELVGYQPVQNPSIMDPMIMAALMDDIPRMAWLVFRCAGNLNDAYVFLPDIPTYLQGRWEAMAGKCRSAVLPLHVGVMQKNFHTVRLMLDLGADPNTFGVEFSGDRKKDATKRANMLKEKTEAAKSACKMGAQSIPYQRLWSNPVPGIADMIKGIKSFVSTIELPGLSKPHPWVSPLHLACRFGQASITQLLIKRGAMMNGGGSALYARKSPLDEALAYARSNCQSYNALSDRKNFQKVMELANWEESDSAAEEHQAAKRVSRYTELLEKAQEMVEETDKKLKKAGKSASGLSPQSLLEKSFSKMGISIGGYADFSFEALKGCKVPDMNTMCKIKYIAQQAMKMVGAIFGAFDPMKMTMKALCMAVKVIIKVIMKMMKRPIAHYDPAMYTAHVMLYHRCPINVSDTQTKILLKDLMDNSTYRWLGITTINDKVWTRTAANKAYVLKTNHDYGAEILDTAAEPVEFFKAKKLLDAQFEQQTYNTSIEAFMPAYFLPVLKEHLSVVAHGGAPDPAKLKSGSSSLYGNYVLNQVLSQRERAMMACMSNSKPKVETDAAKAKAGLAAGEERINQWAQKQAAEMKQASQAKFQELAALQHTDTEATLRMRADRAALEDFRKRTPKRLEDLEPEFKKVATKINHAMLPQWFTSLPENLNMEPEGAIDIICSAVSEYNPETVEPLEYEGLDSSNDFLGRMCMGKDSIEVKKIKFDTNLLKGKELQASDLAMVDVVKTMQTAYIDVLTKASAEALAERLEVYAEIVKEFGQNRCADMQRVFAEKKQVVEKTLEGLKNGEFAFDEEALFGMEMDKAVWAAVGKKLGPNGPKMVEMLSNLDTCPSPSELLEMAKGMVGEAAEGRADMFLDRLEKDGKVPFLTSENMKAAVKDIVDGELPDVEGMVEGLENLAEDGVEKLLDKACGTVPIKGKLKSVLAKVGNAQELLNMVTGNNLQCVSALTQKLENLELDMVSDALCGLGDLDSLEAMGAQLEEVGTEILDNLEMLGENVIEEMTAGLELDLSVDVEGLIAVMQQAQDALMTILEFIGDM